MSNFKSIFKKVGGKEILKQYARAHVLSFALFQTLLNGFSKKSLEIVRLAVDNKILKKLRKKNKKFVSDFKENLKTEELQHIHSNKIWICWLQGIENAPPLVQKCYQSIKENIKDREVILLTADNYHDYVQFPDYIQEKIDKGIISRTHMSDLLRLELLIKYGGTWIDATVFCSGNNIPDYMLDSDLFVFQCLKPGLDGHVKSISSWFITAYSNHPILILTRELLYNYWKKKKSMINYFLIHLFFQLATEAYPEEWKKVVPFSNSLPHILLLRLFENYDKTVWNAAISMTPFHKLSYKFSDEQKELKDTYYKKIVEE